MIKKLLFLFIELIFSQDRLNPSARLASQNATIADFLHYAPIRDWVPARLREQVPNSYGKFSRHFPKIFHQILNFHHLKNQKKIRNPYKKVPKNFRKTSNIFKRKWYKNLKMFSENFPQKILEFLCSKIFYSFNLNFFFKKFPKKSNRFCRPWSIRIGCRRHPGNGAWTEPELMDEVSTS